MTEPKKVIVPTHVQKSTGQRLTNADLMKISEVPREIKGTERAEVHARSEPEYRGDEILRKFLPYFVISTMSLILVGGVVALLGLVIPMIMAMILAIVASFVSMILSLVVTIIAGVAMAVGIGYLQTINGKPSKINKRR